MEIMHQLLEMGVFQQVKNHPSPNPYHLNQTAQNNHNMALKVTRNSKQSLIKNKKKELN